MPQRDKTHVFFCYPTKLLSSFLLPTECQRTDYSQLTGQGEGGREVEGGIGGEGVMVTLETALEVGCGGIRHKGFMAHLCHFVLPYSGEGGGDGG